MRKLSLWVYLTLLVLLFNACKKDDDGDVIPNPEVPTLITITAEDFATTIDENPEAGFVLGTISAVASDESELIYSLSDQSVAGALAIDSKEGTLTVLKPYAFDFETNPTITANFIAQNGTEVAIARITITLNDVFESSGDRPFITMWETTNTDEIVVIQVQEGALTYDYTVDWGDGTTTTETGHAVHTYAEAGTHQVSISGTFPAIALGFYSHDENDPLKLKSIEQWGDIAWESMYQAFDRCENMELLATDVPNLTNVSSLENMFSNVTSLNADLSTWDVSNITDMSNMFTNVSSLEVNISTWNVSNVTDMRAMFSDIGFIDVDLSTWNVSSVTDMFSMFSHSSFNGNISSWNVSNVEDMAFMFNESSFNGNISSWEVSKVESMFRMFEDATTFNQNISGWNVNNVTNCSEFSLNAPLTSSNKPTFTSCTP